jgi:hypothetical protein
VSLIFPPGSFFAAHRSFLPRTPTFKIAAGAFVAGALVATVASNAPKRSSPTDTAAQTVAVSAQKVAAAVEAKSTGTAEKAKPAKRPEIAAKPNAVAPESREVVETRPAALREPVTVSDAASAPPGETDDNVGSAATEAMPSPREAVPSPRPKPQALTAMTAKPAAMQEAPAPAPRPNADALAVLIAKLNAADAAGAPAPETVELPIAEAPAETPSAMPAPAPDVKAAEAKPSATKPAESKPIEAKPSEAKPAAVPAAAAARPAVVKRVTAKRVARHEDPSTKPLHLADVRAQQPMRSLVQSRNHADGFTLVRSRTLPDGRRVTVWQRPVVEPPRSSSPLLAFGSLFGGRY